MIEIIKDKTLFKAVRAAASTALISEPGSPQKIDLAKLAEIPLLQSIYTEILRMHVAINITRSIEKDMSLDGYALKKGYLVQTPSYIGHFDESIWSEPEHPASEFWAERHILYDDEKDELGNIISVPRFSMAGKTGGYFPYGGFFHISQRS